MRHAKMRDSNHRKLRFESLEDRRMLATGLGEGAANPTLELVHGPTGTIPYCASSVCNVSLTATVKSNATSSDYNLVADWYANAISASGGTVGVTFDVDEFHHDLSGSLSPSGAMRFISDGISYADIAAKPVASDRICTGWTVVFTLSAKSGGWSTMVSSSFTLTPAVIVDSNVTGDSSNTGHPHHFVGEIAQNSLF